MIKKIYKLLVSEKHRLNLRRFANRVRHSRYLGDKYHCSCCDKTFKIFLPKGNVLRQNAECPYCGSLERTRLLDLYLDRELNFYNKTDISLLHIAPEWCLKQKFSSLKNIEYIDGDLHPAYADHIVDLTDITYPERYFDYIICSHVLGHIPDEAKAITEMHRVLKPGGIAFVMTLINNDATTTLEDHHVKTAEDRLRTYGEKDLFRLHGRDFGSRLEQGGFAVEVIDYRLSFSESDRTRFSLGNGERELIYICKKNISESLLDF